MKLKNVYAGCTKDKKDRVFQKRFKEHEGCTYSVYVDLKTNEEFTSMEVDTDTLVPYGKMISNKKYAFKRKVIKTFKTNMKLLYHVDNLFVGKIYKVDWIYSPYVNKYYSKDNRPMDVSFKQGNRVFVKVCNTEYRDLITQEIYRKIGEDTLNIGDLCVSDLKNAQEALDLSVDEQLVSKQYVLRKFYRKYDKK